MQQNWHHLKTQEVLELAQSTARGLSDQEASSRLKKFGFNQLPTQKPYSKLRLFLNQFKSPLMYILFGTIAISLILRHYTDTFFIVLVLFANTIVGFYQENKANNSINELKRLVKITARVLRNNTEQEIESRELVAGDIVILHAGSKIPADARILECRNFKVNEASLTGESAAVAKQTKKLAPNLPLAERTNMIFMGTIAEEGWAKAVVVATGLNTQMGEIVSLLSETEEPQTPLQRQIDHLAKLAAGFVLVTILIIMAIGWLRLEKSSDILLASLSLAVSAIPSGLLPGITVILVLGMRRILKQKGLVRKLVSTETLGSVTVIATDKTGTLTEGRMAVTHLITPGLELTGESLTKFNLANPDPTIQSAKNLIRIAALNNDAYIENPLDPPDKWVMRGKTTEQALLKQAILTGFSKQTLEEDLPLLDKIYFSSDIKFSATLRKVEGNQTALFAVGAPEIILAHVASATDSDGKNMSLASQEFKIFQNRIDELTTQGLRVVACASANFINNPKYKNLSQLVEKLTLVGLIALEDPIRAEVADAIATTKRAGIKTIIVTGDHKLTALAVAKSIGLLVKPEQVLDGDDLEQMDDATLELTAPGIVVYARVSPRHKLRIVNALRARGEIVAMVGDGVNDAPALKSADIGVAVNSGTDVAREVADLILLDDGFHSIVKSIEQGRISFANIRKVFIYLVADDFSELFIFLMSMIFALPLPLLPAQILWINLVEDGLPDLALTTEQETFYVMDRPPRKHGEPILTRPLKHWLACIFAISGLAAFLLYYFSLTFGHDLDKVRSMVFALMGLDSLIFAYSMRSFHRTVFRRDIFSNKLLVIATLISLIFLLGAIYTPIMQKLLTTHGLVLWEWLVVLAVSAGEIILIETTKKIFVAKKI